MAEDWLDIKAMALLNKKPTGFIDDPISIDSSDDDAIIIESSNNNQNEMNYIESKVNIKLPNSEVVEKLEYIPPQIPKKNQANGPNSSTEPHFIKPEEHFDMFEHFHFSWIPVPEFEDQS